LKKNRPRPAGLSLGRTPLQAVVLPLKAIWAIVLSELFHNTFDEIVDEKY
jgi:hypothetical protein